MNIFIAIDHSWSYRFFEFNKPAIAQLDFFAFQDRFYTCALNYCTAHINHRFGLSSIDYNECMSAALRICDEYSQLGAKIHQAYRDLYATHRVAFSALQGRVVNSTCICDELGILIGIVYAIDIRSDLNTILQT